MTFEAKVITGDGRGKELGFPTLNLDLQDIPQDLDAGIFACRVQLGNHTLHNAVMHHGPRPVFEGAMPSCEVHVLDKIIDETPENIECTIAGFIRDIAHFDSPSALIDAIESDIEQARVMLQKQ